MLWAILEGKGASFYQMAALCEKYALTPDDILAYRDITPMDRISYRDFLKYLSETHHSINAFYAAKQYLQTKTRKRHSLKQEKEVKGYDDRS